MKLRRDTEVSIKSSDLSSVEEKTQHLKRFYRAVWECGGQCLHNRGFIQLWKNKVGKLHLSIVSIVLIVWN